MDQPTFGSLFSGIGGMDLGLERAGWRCAWQVENDTYCNRVLEKHWPDVQKFGDIRDVTDPPSVDLIAGGFPCQDVSNAGNKEGISGARSGLWTEMFRIVCLVRPRFVLVENVPGLLVRGMDAVLGDLAKGGYDAEWDCIPAAAFGCDHIRWRTFILAYPLSSRCERILCGGNLRIKKAMGRSSSTALGAMCATVQRLEDRLGKSSVFRTSYGLTSQLDRLANIGNSVVPQVAEWLGRRILEVI